MLLHGYKLKTEIQALKSNFKCYIKDMADLAGFPWGCTACAILNPRPPGPKPGALSKLRYRSTELFASFLINSLVAKEILHSSALKEDDMRSISGLINMVLKGVILADPIAFDNVPKTAPHTCNKNRFKYYYINLNDERAAQTPIY